MKKSELKQIIKEEISHFLKNPTLQKINKIMFNLYDEEKINEKEYQYIQTLLKKLDNK